MSPVDPFLLPPSRVHRPGHFLSAPGGAAGSESESVSVCVCAGAKAPSRACGPAAAAATPPGRWAPPAPPLAALPGSPPLRAPAESTVTLSLHSACTHPGSFLLSGQAVPGERLLSSCDQPRPPPGRLPALGPAERFPSESHLPGPDAPGCPLRTGLFPREPSESPPFPSTFLQSVSSLDKPRPTRGRAPLAPASSPPDQVSSGGGPPGVSARSSRRPCRPADLQFIAVQAHSRGGGSIRLGAGNGPWRSLILGEWSPESVPRVSPLPFLLPSEPCPCAPQETSPHPSLWDPRPPLLAKKASCTPPLLSSGMR